MQATRRTCVVSAGLHLALAFLTSVACNAETGERKATAGALAGRVVDSTGEPVSGATVWLVGGPYDHDAKALMKTVADAQGRFVLRNSKEYIRPNWPVPHVVARDSRGRLGGDVFPWAWPRWTPRQNLRVQLQEVREYRGRVEDAAGKPIANARVRLGTIYASSIHDAPSAGIELGTDLSGELSCQTAADGAFTLPGAPTSGSVCCRVTAAGFGSPSVIWDVDAPVTLRLARSGSIRGSLAVPGNASVREAVKFQLYGGARTSDAKAAFRVFYHATASSGKDGTFRFDDVPAGTHTVNPELYASPLPYYAKQQIPVEVAADKTAAVKVELFPAVAVRGRVIDGKTKQGVAGVKLRGYQMSPEGRQNGAREVTSGADGRFVVYLPPGKVRVNVGETPEDYVQPLQVGDYRSPKASYFPTADARKDVVWPTIELERAARLDGVVVDESGKPVADAEVECLMSRGGMAAEEIITQRSAADGTFTIKGLRAKEPAAIRARTDTAVSDVIERRPIDVAGTLRLAISPGKASMIRGRCVDTVGRPVRRAAVAISGIWILGAYGLSFTGGLCDTDAEGRFAVRNLWPGFSYQASVTAKGYEKAETSQFRVGPGQTMNLRRLTLVAVNGSVEGIATDSSGRPLAGVRVFNAGDAPKLLSTHSDAKGRFRLVGLRIGPLFVFAEKDGYRFAAVATQANRSGVSLRLLRNDEPVSPWKPERPPASPAYERKVVRRLLEKLWAAPGGKSRWAVEYMARLDPEQALKWSKTLGGGFDGLAHKAAAEQIAADDAEEAISLLVQCNDRDAYFSLNSLAERFAASDPQKARQFAEEAIQRARRLDQPERSWAMAAMSQFVTRLGDVEAGKKLAEEAAVAAAKMGTDIDQTYYRGLVATALAPHDFAGAMKLLKPCTDVYPSGRGNEKQRAMARIATVIAVQNLDKALEIVGRLDKNSTQRDNVRMQIAYNLAPTRPRVAIRVVEGMDAYAAVKSKAEAYGWIATVIAPHDAKLARSLIDRSMGIYWDQPEPFRGWSSEGGRSGFAAELAVQAKQIGYPDLGELVDRVLAIRPVAEGWSSPTEIQQTAILTARVLALVDPQSATQLLLGTAPNDQTADGVRTVMGNRGLLTAWALADLDHAAGVIERWIEVSPGDVWNDSLIRVVDILTAPPTERMRCMLRFEGFWFPGED